MRAFTWTIGPASSAALVAKRLVVTGKRDDKTVVVDGKLDERFWKLDQAIARKVKGTPTKQASFGIVWTHQPRGDRKLIGRQLLLAVKVLDGPKGRTPKDGIHIFLDGNRNQSVIYSGDDTHFFIPRNHKGGWAQSVRGKVNWFTDARVQEIEGGYTMEISMGGGSYCGGEVARVNHLHGGGPECRAGLKPPMGRWLASRTTALPMLSAGQISSDAVGLLW